MIGALLFLYLHVINISSEMISNIHIRGYVDDPRNTDNAWMETVAFNFHDPSGQEVCIKLVINSVRVLHCYSFEVVEFISTLPYQVGQLPLQAGDDAGAIQWMPLNKEVRHIT